MINQERIDCLFWQGVELFNSGEYFDAHEEWEELWSEFNLPDRFFIQGLIQATVSFYHLSTGNLKGSRSLMGRALDKFTEKGPNKGIWESPHRGVETFMFIRSIIRCNKEINIIQSALDFNWQLVPKIIPINKKK
ncbi:MAG: hypothetical protein CMG75_00740 [Candidatus Marinimicrobia bacterium]|nr:hypothetical protein [Candidatus Neomarinimicrobiota bacterium]